MFLSNVFADNMEKRALEDKPPRDVEIPALLWAIDYGHQHMINLIISQPGFSPENEATRYAVHYAASANDMAIVDSLIAAGFDVNKITGLEEGSNTALHSSAANAHPAAVECLIRNGANLAIKDFGGKTALERAVYSPKWLVQTWETNAPVPFCPPSKEHAETRRVIEHLVLRVLRLLFDHGDDDAIFVVDDRGDTLLHHAVYDCIGLDFGSDVKVGSGIVRLLLGEGADMWALNNDGFSAVDQAIYPQTCSRTALDAFLDMGLDVNHKDEHGNTILYQSLTCTEEAYPIVSLLLNRGASMGDINFREFFSDIQNPDPVLFFRFVRLLIQFGLRFYGDESECFTFATDIGDLGVMDIVYDFGADINVAARRQGMWKEQTPLQIAIGRKRVDMLEYLLDRDVKMSEEERIKVSDLLERVV